MSSKLSLSSSFLNHCPHVLSIAQNLTPDHVQDLKQNGHCEWCQSPGPNLWLCLHTNCLKIGCGERDHDHSTQHYQESDHKLVLNLITLRIWCYACHFEVFLDDTSVVNLNTIVSPIINEDNGDSSEDDLDSNPRGLTGLQNIGNTCYMNAAVQALSNTPPLTEYFLDCGHMVRDVKPGLSKSYMKLMQEVWSFRRPSYLIPNSVLQAVRSVHPMFRGFQQHDTQEFLRCFMDIMHEELKQPVYTTDDGGEHSDDATITDVESDGSSDGSEADYETADSGLSENSDSRLRRRRKRRTILTSLSVPIDLPADASPPPNNEETDFADARSDTSPSPKMTTQRKLFSPTMNLRRTRLNTSETSQKSYSGNRNRKIRYRSIVSDIFDGKILSSVQCLTCNRVSSTKETFQDLSLPIPTRDHLNVLHSQPSQMSRAHTPLTSASCTDVQQGWISWMLEWLRSWFLGPSVSLHDCLASFFSADELKGDNMYSCDKCKKLRNGIKFCRVLELPEVLCIHLKRFRHELMFSAKINSSVEFPLEGLDMSSYFHKSSPSKETSYDLIGVICHHGTAGGGHYTAYALNAQNNKWYEYDDQYVTAVSPDTVQNCEAYVLFYRKWNEEARCRRQRTLELLKLAKNEPPLFQFYISKQWLNRFNTFSQPGPIDNSDFLCPHGGVRPEMTLEELQQTCILLPHNVWEYLHDQFDGGPICNRLYACDTCVDERAALQQRQRDELREFMRLQREFTACDSQLTVYAISLSWFRRWESFVVGREMEPPSRIDNSPITTRQGGHVTLRNGSDHAQISQEMWRFLHDIYDGGPEVKLQVSTNEPPSA